MLTRISSRELSGWQAFERVHGPLGQRRDDIHTAMILAMIANSNRPKGKAPIPVEKFLPEWDDRPQTDEDMWAAIRQTHDAFAGGTDGEQQRRRKFRSM